MGIVYALKYLVFVLSPFMNFVCLLIAAVYAVSPSLFSRLPSQFALAPVRYILAKWDLLLGPRFTPTGRSRPRGSLFLNEVTICPSPPSRECMRGARSSLRDSERLGVVPSLKRSRNLDRGIRINPYVDFSTFCLG